MQLDFTADKSTLGQVMAWCRQATSHYLNQCRPRSMSPYGVTRSQRINSSFDYENVPCYNGTTLLGRICGVMMTSSNGNIFSITGPLCRQSTDHRWIPLTMDSEAELWPYLWYSSEPSLSKQSRCKWFRPSCSSWRHCNCWMGKCHVTTSLYTTSSRVSVMINTFKAQCHCCICFV